MTAISLVQIDATLRIGGELAMAEFIAQDEAAIVGRGIGSQPDVDADDVAAVRRTIAEKVPEFGRGKCDSGIGEDGSRGAFIVDGAAIARIRIDPRWHVDRDDGARQIANALVDAIESNVVARFVPRAKYGIDDDDIASARPFQYSTGVVCISNVKARQRFDALEHV